jgi:hypothetical protein
VSAHSRSGSERGIIYSSEGTAHIVTDAETYHDADLRECVSVLCGASSPPKLLPLNGVRLVDEHRKGNVCDRCLDRLREREASIPAFMSDGEVRSLDTEGEQGGESA